MYSAIHHLAALGSMASALARSSSPFVPRNGKLMPFRALNGRRISRWSRSPAGLAKDRIVRSSGTSRASTPHGSARNNASQAGRKLRTLVLPHRNVEGHRIHDTLTLRLHPHPVYAGAGKCHVELELFVIGAVVGCLNRVDMDHIHQVGTRRQHVRHRTEVGLDSI